MRENLIDITSREGLSSNMYYFEEVIYRFKKFLSWEEEEEREK